MQPISLRAPQAGLAVTLAGTLPAAAQPLNYTLDPAQSWVHFEVLHFGLPFVANRVRLVVQVEGRRP